MNFHQLTIAQAHEGLLQKSFSSQELTRACLARIQERQPAINAFITLVEDSAMAQARAVDARIARGENIHHLAGIPCAVKDAILVQDIRATSGSNILKHYTAAYDATVITKLKAAGAVILGKTNMDEFAMGSSGETSAYGPTHNPHDITRVPGGSSSGSAASVADNQVIFSLGSDTGGSIRQPAALCGVVGFKPTYGAVSRYGLIAMTSSLDQIGPMTRTVEDAKLVFDTIRGKDPMDATSFDLKIRNSKFEIRNLRIGIPQEYFIPGMDPEVEALVRGAIKKFEAQGAQIHEVHLPLSLHSLAVYHILMPAEVSTNLARFDGIRYGTPEERGDILDQYCATRGIQFGPEVRRRIMLGAYVLSAGHADAYYKQALKVKAMIRHEFEEVFSKVDVLFTPTTPTPAFKLGEKVSDPLTMYLCDILTVPVNIADIPAISVPCGTSHGLPVGLQVIGPYGGDDRVLEVAKMWEKLIPNS